MLTIRRKLLPLLSIFCLSLLLAISCRQTPQVSDLPNSDAPEAETIVIGYSNWAGWWPWAIAEQEGLFAINNLKVEMKWFDSYLQGIEALAAGQLDGNCQTLNDTISFAADAVNSEVAILVNDNSAGNDKIIVAKEINTIEDLQDKEVAVQEGTVSDFLLTLALKSKGRERSDVEIVPLETGGGAAAFASGQVDAVVAFPPSWLTALKRQGSQELISSAEFPGAIPDLLVVTQKLIDEKPDKVQALINTWFDILDFIEQNPQRADEIMAARADLTLEELQLFKEGTKMFTIEDNLAAFNDGDSMKHLPFTARQIADFMVSVDFMPQAPDLTTIFDARFVRAYAAPVE